jgi:hypothetical protein
VTPIHLDFQIFRGATFRESIQWSAGDPPEEANPVDLTGCSMRMQMRANYDSPDPALISLTSEPEGGIIIDAEIGKFTFYLSAENTVGLPAIKGVYDVKIEFSNGDVERFLQGKISVSPEVTR